MNVTPLGLFRRLQNLLLALNADVQVLANKAEILNKEYPGSAWNHKRIAIDQSLRRYKEKLEANTLETPERNLDIIENLFYHQDQISRLYHEAFEIALEKVGDINSLHGFMSYCHDYEQLADTIVEYCLRLQNELGPIKTLNITTQHQFFELSEKLLKQMYENIQLLKLSSEIS